VQRDYPKAEKLPLPANIDSAESTRFSPLRNRDITSSAINIHEMIGIDVTLGQIKPEMKTELDTPNDPRLQNYDPQSAINLSSMMQSNVPDPYGGDKFSHLNMPGGSWGQQTKYLSHELNSSHYTQLRQDSRKSWSKYSMSEAQGMNKNKISISFSLLNPFHQLLVINKRFISMSSKSCGAEIKQGESAEIKETGKLKLKRAVKEYGSTVIIFHVGISLVSYD
jgi:hypothetical protein